MFIDPFGDMGDRMSSRGIVFDYPPIEGVTPDLLLVTHEHLDHNGVEAVGGDPVTLCARPRARTSLPPARWSGSPCCTTRSPAPFARPEHHLLLHARRGLRFCHFGMTSARSALRPEQQRGDRRGRRPVSPRPSAAARLVGGEEAAAIVRMLRPRPGRCRCTTGRRRSTSSTLRTRSSTRSAHAWSAFPENEFDVEDVLEVLMNQRSRYRRSPKESESACPTTRS